jgi:hypothetical protein
MAKLPKGYVAHGGIEVVKKPAEAGSAMGTRCLLGRWGSRVGSRRVCRSGRCRWGCGICSRCRRWCWVCGGCHGDWGSRCRFFALGDANTHSQPDDQDDHADQNGQDHGLIFILIVGHVCFLRK